MLMAKRRALTDKEFAKLLANKEFRKNVIGLAKELVQDDSDSVITVEIEHILEEFVEGQIDHGQLSRALQHIAGGPTLH
jgi:hypothetical protein